LAFFLQSCFFKSQAKENSLELFFSDNSKNTFKGPWQTLLGGGTGADEGVDAG
jgi:hypothetical protein